GLGRPPPPKTTGSPRPSHKNHQIVSYLILIPKFYGSRPSTYFDTSTELIRSRSVEEQCAALQDKPHRRTFKFDEIIVGVPPQKYNLDAGQFNRKVNS
ncbi:MAG: hypothetical protein LH628_02875, partial [Microcoleus sp. CAN_BIN18]|nr:hypothetical protein [Microcoleus sp. CAN_BIN18]